MVPTPEVRKAGPLICRFDGPAEKLEIDLVESISTGGTLEFELGHSYQSLAASCGRRLSSRMRG